MSFLDYVNDEDLISENYSSIGYCRKSKISFAKEIWEECY